MTKAGMLEQEFQSFWVFKNKNKKHGAKVKRSEINNGSKPRTLLRKSHTD